jgi:putative ABC transport system permease protein
MILNYIKIAWRNLINQKLYSFINITGLAVGLAVCMLILLYVAHEHSYDNFHKNANRIFKPSTQIIMQGNTMNMAFMSYASAALIKQSQPAVEDYMRTLKYFKQVVVNNPKVASVKFSETKLLFVDAGFFNFFSFKLISGNAADVLKKPFSVVISKDIAKKYFGDQEPVGKTLVIKTDSAYTYQVTGVAENPPSNSSVDFNFVASNSGFITTKEATFYKGLADIGPGSFDMYFLLKHPSDTATLSRNLSLMAKKNINFPDEKFSFISLLDTHLKNNFGDSSNTKYLTIFPLVAVLILLLALVNYMSLSTARATLRAKEVGVRKVSGASRKTIAMQFYIESALFTCLSFAIGYLLCYMVKPWFLNVLQLKIDNSFFYSPMVFMLMLALLVITILLAGSYPSLVLSAFKPVITLKGKMSKHAGGITVRKVFTILQFSISVGLIICGIIIDRQLYYFRHVDTGLNRDNVVMIPIGNSFGRNYPTFKKEIQSLPAITGVGTSHYQMFKGYDMYFVNGKTKNDKNVGLAYLVVDEDFIKTMGVQWKYPPLPNTDLTGKNKTIINEVAAEQLHLPANPIGSHLESGDNIMGEFKNFNFSSLQSSISPLSLSFAADSSSYFRKHGCVLYAKINAHTNLPTLLSKIEGIYKKYDQDMPFSYSFVDDAFNEQYKAEDRLAAIFSVFTYITIMIATLGLFGLAAFTIEQRTKEIGIRKVLGASLTSITTLLSKDFLKLVLLAIIIGSPIAWWAMNKWLQSFAYRITIGWWVFALAGGVAVLIALVTVSFQSIKAAVANPVKSLKSE